MRFYTDLFTPETYQEFGKSSREVSGFRLTQKKAAQKVRIGDRFICYMTKLSRWIGVLEVVSECYVDETPIFYPANDPFVVRFRVRPTVWLPRDRCVPIRDNQVWDALTFTKGTSPTDGGWTGMVRRSLNRIPDEDGRFLEQLLRSQESGGETYPVDDEKFRRLVSSRIRRADKIVTVTVPENDAEVEADSDTTEAEPIRQSSHMQALLAKCGERMGFKTWLPRNDRASVQKEWTPESDALIDVLPLNYDDTTLRTIEQIDVLWLKGRAIIRAFEVEHTTAVYSGILRMADLLALQPNMDIKLHIVAPESRKQKVFTEILRPVFSLLERAPLSESCTFLSYDSLEELLTLKHIGHISDTVLDDYAEEAE
ncbi:MAG: EVE domain-containing protein [Pirellulaceae bacterium]|nr:EVE domain-containing protein [Pirellulaceae bacterium]